MASSTPTAHIPPPDADVETATAATTTHFCSWGGGNNDDGDGDEGIEGDGIYNDNALGGQKKNKKGKRKRHLLPRLRKSWTAFAALAFPYFRESRRGRWSFASLIVLMLLNSAVRVLFSFLSRDFWTALGDQDSEQFYKVIKQFCIALVVLVPINVLYRYQRQLLAVYWRQWMTDRLLQLYCANDRVYYHLEQQWGGNGTGSGTGDARGYSGDVGCVGDLGVATDPSNTDLGYGTPSTASTSASPSPQATTDRIDNPDQRLAEDVKSFTGLSLSLFLTVAVSFIDLVCFSVILYAIRPQLFLSILGFCLFGTVMTYVVGRSLVKLNFERLRREADFRFSLVRIRENVESIAFFRGQRIERLEVSERFDSVLDNAHDVIKTQRNLDLFTSLYNYLTWILPIVVIAPDYFAGDVALGVIQQSAVAFGHVLDDLSLIINEFESLTEFSASLERLFQFVTAIHSASDDGGDDSGGGESAPLLLLQLPPGGGGDEDDGGPSSRQDRKGPADTAAEDNCYYDVEDQATNTASTITPAKHAKARSAGISMVTIPANSNYTATALALSIRHLHLSTPDRSRLLLQDLDLELPWGERLLVVGPSGVGKSSLIRAIAGLWTRCGTGTITKGCDDCDAYFVPQRPYCPLGTLRDQLLYPHVGDDAIPHCPGGGGTVATKVTLDHWTDDRLLDVLHQIQLGDLTTRFATTTPSGSDGGMCNTGSSGLNVRVDWSNTLSLGEQQRLAFGRILVHRPRLVVLDESTSAMDVACERKMYSMLNRLLSEVQGSLVSVGHRPTLVEHHTMRLDLRGVGEYEMTKLS